MSNEDSINLGSPRPELHPELMSLYGLNPFIRGISASRAAMFTGNLAAMVVIKEPSRKRIYTGMERRFTGSTFRVEFKSDVEVLEVLPRFANTAGANRIRHSPQTAIIYENRETGSIGLLMLEDHNITHQHFGTEYKRNRDVLERIRKGARFAKGTVLAQSPNISDDQAYMYGLEANLLLASDVAGTEDGVKVRRGFMEKLAPTGFETRVFEFGREYFPINQSTRPDVYKCIPDIGDRIDSSGRLVSLRRYDPISAVSNMTVESLQQPDYIFDKKRYVQHPDAEVIDVVVERNTAVSIPPLPVGMEDQLLKYYNADTEWYKRIIDVWVDLRKRYAQRKATLNLEPALTSLIFDAIARVGPNYAKVDGGFNRRVDDNGGKVEKVYHGVRLDAWRVTIKFKYLSVPNKGYKITDIHGDKSIVVEVVDDEDMPVDENGVVADIVADPNSRWNRVTAPSPIEVLIGAAARDLGKRIQEWFGYDRNIQLTEEECEDVVMSSGYADVVDRAYDELMEFYKVVCPLQAKAMQDPEFLKKNPDHKYQHVISVLHDHMYGLDMFFPPDNPVNIPDVIRTIKERWPPFITPVRFRGRDGKMKVTREPMLIGPSYYINLEKTAEDSWMAAGSAKYNVFGTTARLNNNDKYDVPGRHANPREGESEIRAMAAAVGGAALADYVDAGNNPIAQRYILNNIINHPTPTNIEEVLDRTVVPVGGHRPLAYVRHMFQCSGKEYSNE
jgi:hypothetical protein